jgi:hypothetical protein
MAELVEQASELIDILQPNRADCHRGHLDRSMERPPGEDPRHHPLFVTSSGLG